MTHDKQRCVEIPETIRSKQPSVKVFYYHINILLADQCLRGVSTTLEENQMLRYCQRGKKKKKGKNPGIVHVLLMLKIKNPSKNEKKNCISLCNNAENSRRYRE